MHKIQLNLENSDRQTGSRSALTRLAYSPHEGAQVLGISRSKIYELIAARDLKVIKLGSRTLVLHSELVRFVARLALVDAAADRKPHSPRRAGDAPCPTTRTPPGAAGLGGKLRSGRTALPTIKT